MPPTTSTALSPTDTFAERHLGPGGAEQAKMLSELGFSTLDDLAAAAVPAAIRSLQPLDLPEALGESATTAELRRYASENRVVPSLIGLGYHGTLTPPVIQRNVLEDPSWYTAYTPYQPEISQGRLEALLNFQTMVSDLTGMELANASLLDEPTAAAEAMAMARRLAPSRPPIGSSSMRAATRTRSRWCGRGPSRSASSSKSATGRSDPRGCRAVRRARAEPVNDGRDPRPPRSLATRRTSARSSWSRPTSSPAASSLPQANRVRTSSSDRRNGSASRSASAARTRGSSRRRRRTHGRCPVGSSVCRETTPDTSRCGSRSRRENSTSGARRRRATSAPRRCSSRSSRRCTPCTTVPTD